MPTFRRIYQCIYIISSSYCKLAFYEINVAQIKAVYTPSRENKIILQKALAKLDQRQLKCLEFRLVDNLRNGITKRG